MLVKSRLVRCHSLQRCDIITLDETQLFFMMSASDLLTSNFHSFTDAFLLLILLSKGVTVV